MTSLQRSENSDCSGLLQPMLPNADRLQKRQKGLSVSNRLCTYNVKIFTEIWFLSRDFIEFKMEVCVDSVQSALNAEKGGECFIYNFYVK